MGLPQNAAKTAQKAIITAIVGAVLTLLELVLNLYFKFLLPWEQVLLTLSLLLVVVAIYLYLCNSHWKYTFVPLAIVFLIVFTILHFFGHSLGSLLLSRTRFRIEEPEDLGPFQEYAMVSGRLDCSFNMSDLDVLVYVRPNPGDTWCRCEKPGQAERRWSIAADYVTFPLEYQDFTLIAILASSDEAESSPRDLKAKDAAEFRKKMLEYGVVYKDDKDCISPEFPVPRLKATSTWTPSASPAETSITETLPSPNHTPALSPTHTPTHTPAVTGLPAATGTPTMRPTRYVATQTPTLMPTSVPTPTPTTKPLPRPTPTLALTPTLTLEPTEKPTEKPTEESIKATSPKPP